MFISRSLMLLALCLFVAGCGGGDRAETPPAGETELGDAGSLAPAEPMDAAAEDPPGQTQASTAGPGTIALLPGNTQIQFIGTHVGDDPNPRTCEFTDFSGAVSLDGDGRVASVKVEIQTNSVSTFDQRLTNHLMSDDFLAVRVHPTIVFETTGIDTGVDGTTLTGNLTLMGTTKEVSFPADVSVADGKLALTGSLNINRSEYGMDKMMERVHDEVQINVTVENAG